MNYENEIFKSFYKIYSNPDNKDRYGQVGIFNYRLSYLEKVLSEGAIHYLKEGKSKYGKVSMYGGNLGTYYSVCVTSAFYQECKLINQK